MEADPRTQEMLEALRAESIETWFDLGLFLDRIREEREVPAFVAAPEFDDFARELGRGVAFLTFDIGVDGVSMEIAKYARALRDTLPGLRVHYVAGHFSEAAPHIIDRDADWHRVPEMQGFDAWPLYRDFFRRRLDRGGPAYNEGIGRFWQDTLGLCEILGRIVERGDIQLLFLVNLASNPGNVALALAIALVSEYLRVPVLNNCHDFYWEGGHSRFEREARGLPRGPRDHFFKNAHLGELFSLIDLLYPWEARSWVHVCINASQVETLRSVKGCSPGSLRTVGTAIDTDRFTTLGRGRTQDALDQVCEILHGRPGRPRAHAVEDALKKGLLEAPQRRPLLIAGKAQRQVDLASNNVVLLQPTRILARKRIEVTFRLIRRLFRSPELATEFRNDPEKRLTLLVSGPVATGQDATLDRLLRDFKELLRELDAGVRHRIYLAFLFSAFDDPDFRARHQHPLGMPELYNLASLVVLPSETEGRGLPIIEAAACGTPVVSRRYEPVEVFREVVGENLAREDRLDLHVFEGNRFPQVILDRIVGVLLDPERESASARHNRRVVERRFGMATLAQDLRTALRRLHRQLADPAPARAAARLALDDFRARVAETSPTLESLLCAEKREYLPGFGRMGLMLMLKSLIDPSYFRVEEQRLRGMAFDHARRLEAVREAAGPIELESQLDFYAAVEELFFFREGEMPVRIDHSLSYRHRNRHLYAYRELTPQELAGVVALLHRAAFGRVQEPELHPPARQPITSWHRMVARCCGGEPVLDDRDRLLQRLGENRAFAVFPGPRVAQELEVFVLEAVRRRLGLQLRDEITEAALEAGPDLAPITLIARRDPAPGCVHAGALAAYLAKEAGRELALLADRSICRVVPSEQVSPGIDLRQLGRSAVASLAGIRDANGFVVALCEQAAVTTDGIDLERFHVGRADDPLTANLMGVPEGSGFVSWVPAGLRATLAYPTPVQTARSLGETLRSRTYRRLCKRLGEDAVLAALRDDAVERGSRAEDVLAKLAASGRARSGPVHHEALNGVYADGLPWSGVVARVDERLRYAVLSSDAGNRVVPDFVRRFDRRPRVRARIAWNGGYILNAELVGKLGLPESYVGSPLGLIVSDGAMLCPPLFAKPALLVDADGSLAIRRVSCEPGIRATAGRTALELGPAQRNPERPPDGPCFYDLLAGVDEIPGDGRVIVRLVGNRIMQVLEAGAGEAAPVLPVGLCFSFPPGGLPRGWQEGRTLDLAIPGLEGVAQGVEAGPLLLEDGEVAIDMEREGWKTRASIQTQAARLDYLDMRGPKIAAGLDADGRLSVLAVNGRIRESTGATHVDMAEILKARGLRSAMGFDPGGSATLVVGERVLNISPYNPDYEHNVYALPPEPRGVANVVIGY